MTKTKNERITALENEVAELKLIVHELRERPQLTTVINNAPQGPSTTNTVEDTIEFEGQQYRKVEREAREGDVVVLSGKCRFNGFHEHNVPYKVVLDSAGSTCIGNPHDARVYNGDFNRTSETVDVYKLIVEEKPLTPNQQRAAIIEKAKKFVEENSISKTDAKTNKYVCIKIWKTYIEFVVNTDKRTIVALAKGLATHHVVTRGIAKCLPGDVFNEHIGKAIALGRALGLDVSEFEQAMQPNEVVSGMEVTVNYNNETRIIKQLNANGTVWFTNEKFDFATNIVSIINDTNAIYEGEGEQ